ncbi:phosphotransferase family protein [Leifsonia aquatica]|uniref:phosphotransferase family protein n=1 Tax=Leifsonia aquatica TaxID=144185 RepID=UPI0028A872AF|nr:aminoglycoside phosphotransferase family protein [Leifsonia aquatica]
MEATSDRIRWADAPGELTDEIGRLLGGPVVDAADQTGGYSAGLAVRAGTAGGSRAFVKAAPGELGRTVDLYRREAEVLRRLPDSVPAPALLATIEVGDWFGLVTEEVDGRHPSIPPAHDELRAILDSIGEFPDARGLGLPRLVDELPFAAWPTLVADHADRLTDVERRNGERLTALAAAAGDHLAGDRLVHLDGRADNILLDAGDRVWFVDWAWACVGAPWIDGLAVLLDARLSGSGALLAHPLFAEVPDVAIDGVLAGLAGEFRLNSLQPAPPRMPALRAFQAAEARAARDWLAERGAIG